MLVFWRNQPKKYIIATTDKLKCIFLQRKRRQKFFNSLSFYIFIWHSILCDGWQACAEMKCACGICRFFFAERCALMRLNDICFLLIFPVHQHVVWQQLIQRMGRTDGGIIDCGSTTYKSSNHSLYCSVAYLYKSPTHHDY